MTASDTTLGARLRAMPDHLSAGLVARMESDLSLIHI